MRAARLHSPRTADAREVLTIDDVEVPEPECDVNQSPPTLSNLDHGVRLPGCRHSGHGLGLVARG